LNNTRIYKKNEIKEEDYRYRFKTNQPTNKERRRRKETWPNNTNNKQ
jgi:hypothetical protein